MQLPNPCEKLNSTFPDYRWLNWDYRTDDKSGLEEQVLMPDWGQLDQVIDNFPNPDFPHLFQGFPEIDSRYRLGYWWYCLFERHWSLRGMTNALMDYHLYPEEVHRLFAKITDFYLRIIERAADEQQCDGIWTSDDLGTQTGPFFSPQIFREFFKPYYKKIFDRCREVGVHSWMHACGNVEPLIGDWIEIGLDVIHPIQRHAMDPLAIERKHGGKITFFGGLDVQQVIPWGTPEEVREEVRFLIDTYWRGGKCMITAGNMINGNCSLESLEAFLEETMNYGKKVAARA